MDKIIMCGSDVHENKIVNAIAVEKGEAIMKKTFYNIGGFKELFAELKQLAKENSCNRIVIAYEASSLGYRFYDACKESGIECHILAPTKMKRSAGDKFKTDERDARNILEILRGHLLAGNKLPDIWIPDEELRDDRELTRNMTTLTQDTTEVKTQIRMLLKRNGIDPSIEESTPWSVAYLKWLKSLQLKPVAQLILKGLMERLYFFEKQIKELNAALVKLSKKDRYAPIVKEIKNLNGVGIFTAMTFLLELGKMSRFKNRRKLGAFLGLAPKSYESGEINDCKGHITRNGSSHVRRCLNQAAWMHIRLDPVAKLFYERLVKRNPKSKKKVIVANMRKLAIRMWHLGNAAEMKQAA